MRFLFWFLTAALLLSWPELTAALLETAVWSLTTPAVLVAALAALALYRALHRVQEQAARGWAS